jgi:hypothetical protein
MNQHKKTRHLRPQSVQNWARYEPFFPKDQKVPKTENKSMCAFTTAISCNVGPIVWLHEVWFMFSYLLPVRCNEMFTAPPNLLLSNVGLTACHNSHHDLGMAARI